MFLGYNFVGDQDSLNPTYNNIGIVKKIIMKSAIYDEFIIDKKVKSYNKNKENWSVPTIILAKFQGNTESGNINFGGATVSKLRIKRRETTDFSKWTTIKEYPYTEEAQVIYEYLNQANQEYEYALIAVMSNGAEGNYNTEKITSEFDGAFVLDSQQSFRLIYDLNYGATTRNTASQTYQPKGSKYPIIIKNGNMNYDSGSVNSTILTTQTELNGDISVYDEVKNRKKLMDFLTNGKAKVLKDSNGNLWVIGNVSNPSVDYFNELNQSIAKCSFEWVEIGNATDENDLISLGLLTI